MATPPRIGDVIAGKYCVERVLGQGGMGVVVAARHVHLRELVAIKFIVAADRSGGDLVARFLREGRAAMRIRSEHVVRVHDVGTLDSGEPFLVMEHLEGSDLGAVLAREGPLPVDAAVEHVLQAIEAIAEAHALGIVHRDLKPSNLFLTRRADGSPVVKVLDFGIAKTTFGDASAAETGGLAGTPSYMAPEQMRSRAPIDARADVWALGVTLYALLTGASPFQGGSMLEVHESIVRGARPLREARPDAPAALEAILQRCVRPEPAERFPDVAEVAAALAELAPEHARISARRAQRILSAAPRAEAPDHDGGRAPKPPGEPSPPPEDATGEGTRPAAEASWKDAAREAPPSDATTGSRTGASPPVVTAAPARARPPWRRALALAGAAVAGAVVAAAALGSRGAPPPLPAAAAGAAPTSVPELRGTVEAPLPESRASAAAASSASAPSAEPLASAVAPSVHKRPALNPRVLTPTPAIRSRDPLADPN